MNVLLAAALAGPAGRAGRWPVPGDEGQQFVGLVDEGGEAGHDERLHAAAMLAENGLSVRQHIDGDAGVDVLAWRLFGHPSSLAYLLACFLAEWQNNLQAGFKQGRREQRR